MTKLTRKFSVVGNTDKSAGLNLAFATDDGEWVNQHFGSSKSFVIYDVSPETSHLVSVAEFGDINEVHSDDKLAIKMEFLADCIAVYCRACGASGIRQLLERHIQPLKVAEDVPIKVLIQAFQKELSEGPSSWLARAIDRQAEFADGETKTEKHISR